MFLVDTPEQRRLGVKDSYELALADWMGTAGFDRDEDYWPRQWAEAYVAFAAGEARPWLYQQGMRWFPIVGWAERGGYGAFGHGNSVPRFHITWGTGPGVLEPFVRRTREAEKKGLITLQVPAPRRRALAHERGGRRRARGDPRAQRCAAGREELAYGRR